CTRGTCGVADSTDGGSLTSCVRIAARSDVWSSRMSLVERLSRSTVRGAQVRIADCMRSLRLAAISRNHAFASKRVREHASCGTPQTRAHADSARGTSWVSRLGKNPLARYQRTVSI